MKKQKLVPVLVGNKSYGLYIGEAVESDVKKITAEGSLSLKNARHVSRWYGKSGGITSLAAHGPCGPSVADSRVGAPVDMVATGVVNVFFLTPEAVANFALIKPQ